MSTGRAERLLLFGALAYRLGVVDRQALAAGLRAWSASKADPSGADAALRAGAGLDDARALDVEATARQLLAVHGGDPRRALASVGLDPFARGAVAAVGDAELDRLVGELDDASASDDLHATLAPDSSPIDDRTNPASEAEATVFDPDAPAAGWSNGLEATVAGEPTVAPGSPAWGATPEATQATVQGSRTIESASVSPAPAPRPARAPAYAPQAHDPSATIAVDPLGPKTVAVSPYVREATAPLTVALGSTDPTAALPPSLSGREWQGGPSHFGGGGAGSRFRVVRPHAKGGLGEVFVALDGELNREVALKEIQDRHADDPVSRARFVVEAEVTGGLEHPGIVPVYGLGKYTDGRPYYAMRFIRGESLKEAIAAYHAPHAKGGDGDAPPPSRELELHKLLRRFIDVCNAIDYAHARGVLHRDLKPANIMLGPFGETLVVDWGLAKPLDPPDGEDAQGPGLSRTRARAADLSGMEGPGSGRLRPQSASGSMYEVLFGTTVGTPQYMSPEQADGKNDALGPASDIYSLGATLYSLLAGRAPFTERALQPLLQKVRAGDFLPPRQVDKSVPPALDAICTKAMALKPEARYETAREFAEDIEHWMADDPVSAYAEPWPARAARWARRHRTFVTTGGALLIAAVLGLTTATLLIERERARADEYFRLARSAVDTLLTEFAAIHLVDVPGAEKVRSKILGRSVAFYNEFLRQGRQPTVKQGAGQAYARLGDALEQLGEYPKAEKNLRHAVGMLAPMVEGRGPEADAYRRDLARARHSLGVLLTRTSRYDEAQTELTAAIDLRRALASRKGAADQDRADEKESAYRLGALLARRPGNKGKAQDYYQEALRNAQADVQAPEPADKEPSDPAEAPRRAARYQNQLATLLSRSDDAKSLDQALGLLDAAKTTQLALRGKADTVAAYAWDLARTWSNTASVQRKRERTQAAPPPVGKAEDDPVVKEYTESITLLKRLVNDYPAVPDYRFELAEVELNRARRYQVPHKRDDAAAADLNDARRLLETLARDQPERPDYALRLVSARRRLAAISIAADKTAAETNLRLALIELKAIPKKAPQYASSLDYRTELLQLVATLGGLIQADPKLTDLADDLDQAVKTGLGLLKDEGETAETVTATFNGTRLLSAARRSQKRYEGAIRASLDSAPLLARTQPASEWKVAKDVASILTEAASPALTAKYGPEAVKLLDDSVRAGLNLPAVFDLKEFEVLDAVKGYQAIKRSVKEAGAKPVSG